MDLFNTTRFPPYDAGYTASHDDFIAFCNSYLLERYIVVAKKMCSQIGSRFYTIESEILTRDQKLLPCSNNPVLGSTAIMAIEYSDLNNIRAPKNDDTTSGKSNTKGRDSDTPVTHMNPFYSIQSTDLVMRDEFGNYMQNFRTPQGFTLEFSSDLPINQDIPQFSGNYIFNAIESEWAFDNGIYTIPPWLAALNPSTIPGNTQPLVGPFSTYMSQSAYGLYSTNGGASASPYLKSKLPADFSPNMPISGNLIHFGRVLGY
jgi:hypothetical protein